MGACYLSKVIELAEAEVGYKEKKSNKDLYSKTANAGSGNFTKYADTMDKTDFFNGKKNGFPWCSVFPTYLVYMASGKDLKKTREIMCAPSKNSLSAGCPYAYGYFKKKKQTGTTPKKGSLIYFGSSESKLEHVGFVYKVDSSKIYTIEGNKSNSVKKCSYSKNNKYYYAYPKWDTEPSVKPSEVKDDNSSVSTSTKPQTTSYKVTAPSGLRLRKGAGTDYPIVVVMPYKSTFKVTKTYGSWAYGTYGTRMGWASLSWLTKI